MRACVCVRTYVCVYVCACTFCALDEPVDLWDSDDMSKHVTEPLRVNKVEVTQGRCVVVKHDACSGKG